MFGLSIWEIALALIVSLVVLGPKRLPELARKAGAGLRSLQRASSDLRSMVAEPLREVQEPLDALRDEITGTVHRFEQELHLEDENERSEESQQATSAAELALEQGLDSEVTPRDDAPGAAIADETQAANKTTPDA